MAYTRKSCKSKDNRSETMIAQYRYGLTATQQDLIKENYNSVKDILSLTKRCFKDDFLDENSTEFNNVRKYVVRVRKIDQGKVSEAYNFSDEDIEFIANKCSTNSVIDMCRTLFPDRKDNMIREAQTMADLVKALEDSAATRVYDNSLSLRTEEGELGPYVPPTSDIKILAKINQCDPHTQLNIAKLDSRQKSWIKSLKHNMRSARFIAVMSSIKTQVLRDLLESEFIRATFNQPDSPPDEVNAYISLCNEYVMSAMLSNQLAELNSKLSSAVNDGDRIALHKSISDSRIAVAKEFDECQKRINKLQVDINAKKMERADARNSANESLVKWIELAEIEEGREKLLRLQQARTLQIEKEIKRIESFDHLIAEFHGVSVEEILNF